MKRFTLLRVLLWASAMAFAPQVNAQTADKEVEPPTDAPSPDDVPTTVSAEEANISAADARAAELEAQIEGLQAQLTELKTLVTKAAPSWKGAPQWTDTDEGFSFKVRGRLMLDAGYIKEPTGYVANRNLGFNARVRRLRIGVEGTLPGDFAYKAEVDYANSAISFADVLLTYQPKGKPWNVAFGNMETNNGLEQVTSSRWVSFIERSQMNDAFINTRRLGINLGYVSPDTLFRVNGGLFAAHTIDASLDNDGWIAAARATYTPFVANGFVHIGANFQHRSFQSNASGVASTSIGAPSTNQLARYRARPFLQTTDVRFVDTGNFAATSDNVFGVELFGVFKSLHLGGEAQYTKTNAYSSGTQLLNPRDFFVGNTAITTATGDPSFFSAYAEVGFFLTGETRGYKNGTWDRTKVLNPYNKGGKGAVQLIGRLDYLDLDTAKLKNGFTNNFTTGATSLAALKTRLGRGGKQTGYLFGLTWIPTDYVRFLVNYIHTEVEGGPFAAAFKPLSTKPVDQRTYSVDGFAIRAQFDF
jgi:phosphate-selective porin OprO/OprP